MKIITISGKAEHGKTESAKLLNNLFHENGYKSLILNYGGYVKYVCKTYYHWDGNKDEKGRKLLQEVGTDIGRKKDNDIWVNKLFYDVKTFCEDFDYIIIDDTRFENEVIIPTKLGFDVCSVRIKRCNFENHLTEEQRKHPSETSLDKFKFNYFISVDNNINSLNSCVKELFNELIK